MFISEVILFDIRVSLNAFIRLSLLQINFISLAFSFKLFGFNWFKINWILSNISGFWDWSLCSISFPKESPRPKLLPPIFIFLIELLIGRFIFWKSLLKLLRLLLLPVDMTFRFTFLFPLCSLLNLGLFWGLCSSKFCKESFNIRLLFGILLLLFIILLFIWLFWFWFWRFWIGLFRLDCELFWIWLILFPIYIEDESKVLLELKEFIPIFGIELFIKVFKGILELILLGILFT